MIFSTDDCSISVIKLQKLSLFFEVILMIKIGLSRKDVMCLLSWSISMIKGVIFSDLSSAKRVEERVEILTSNSLQESVFAKG